MLDNNFYFNHHPSINAIQFNDMLLDIDTGDRLPWVATAFNHAMKESVAKGMIKESYFRSFEYFTAFESISNNEGDTRKVDFIIESGMLSDMADYVLPAGYTLERLLEYLGFYDLKESYSSLNEGFFKKIKDKIKKVAKKVGSGVKSAAKAVGKGVKKVAQKVGDLAMSGITGVLKGIKGIIKFVPKILDFIKRFKSIISGGLVKAIDFIVKGADLLKPVFKAVPSFGQILTALSGISAFMKATMVNESASFNGETMRMNEAIGSGENAKKGYIIQGVTLLGMSALGVHVDTEKNKKILDTITTALTGGKGMVKVIITAVGNALGIKLDKVMNFLTEPAKAIASLISGIISSAHDLVKKFWELIGGEKLLSKFLDTVLGKLLKSFVGLFTKKDKTSEPEKAGAPVASNKKQNNGEAAQSLNDDDYNIKYKDNSGDFS
jgi:hypothetical protein